MKSAPEHIKLKGVRQNNLKGFDLDIPLGQLVVVTGLSGAGKSSLVFETLHAEGQRRYVETFSPYTRQFLEIMDRPQVDSIENIRPSIAIQQSNSVKTSRSTVGTMTELCDYFKVWFGHVSSLYDPDTGKKIESDSPQTIWKKTYKAFNEHELLIAFDVIKPENLKWSEIIEPLIKQGYTRVIFKNKVTRITDLDPQKIQAKSLRVIQDRLKISTKNRSRFIDSVATALHYGDHQVHLFTVDAKLLESFSEGLHSPQTGKTFKVPTPASFSFNSPIGACPECKGFGKTAEFDYDRVIPDKNLSIAQGAIKAFNGEVFGECLQDLLRFAPKLKIRTTTPWNQLTKKEQDLVLKGEPDFISGKKTWPQAWYGVDGFFGWLEKKGYKMHIRYVLSRYRTYRECPKCHGARLKPDALYWKWENRTLPELYQLPIAELLPLIKKKHKTTGNHPVDLAADSIITRLTYLDQVGLGYLTLDRTSRTLSGGEVERVNLTTCLGTSLVDTLFVLDEPSVGLHSRDIYRLINIMKNLTAMGNTVVVVEHDENIMMAADHLIEVGPLPGYRGGNITFTGTLPQLLKAKGSITSDYLTGKETIDLPQKRRKNRGHKYIEFQNASQNNIQDLTFRLPLQQFVCISGVSGSGKSTLLNNIIYQGYRSDMGLSAEEPAQIKIIKGTLDIDDVVMVDQGPISKTPRSNPVLFVHAWEYIRQLFGSTDSARMAGMNASHFSFNSGNGRCDHCGGLGYERVEMQFLSDVFVMCPVCEGSRFKPEVLSIRWEGHSVSEILDMDVERAYNVFRSQARICSRLKTLEEVGLGYLKLGQPLNTLSGGESQRLKLVRYISELSSKSSHSLILLDEPTTGLHKDDVRRLIGLLQQLVNNGHSLVVIEHHMDILKSADWIIELGPEAGKHGGQIVAQGTPEDLIKLDIQSQPFLKEALSGKPLLNSSLVKSRKETTVNAPKELKVIGAREHNLKNITVSIPHKKITVVTGVSGSGKSSLAFDIIFAEGQRRFMESISAYARQFVEQLPRPDIDQLSGIAPTVAIEQRVTRGSSKSTVATVTEVAQYLRLLYARMGIQHSPANDQAVVALSRDALAKNLETLLKEKAYSDTDHLYLCAPMIRGRKGHHQPLANWAQSQGYTLLRVNGLLTHINNFEKLDRYKEHDIEVVIGNFGRLGETLSPLERKEKLFDALHLGKGSCFIADKKSIRHWFSTTRTDPVTGEAFPELDPKHFSWNSPKGWCEECQGHGCKACNNTRLNPISRSVKLHFQKTPPLSFPDLLALTPSKLVENLQNLKLDERGKKIVQDLIPQIQERLQFMGQVGLEYLTLNRSSNTLSGGEAQRIRLAAQLSSNLSGVLYVLDEPSIGLHARDNNRLIKSLEELRDKGNTLLVVEHDDDTMRAADNIIDLGPAAGIHGGEVIASGHAKDIIKNKNSLTGKYLTTAIPHPINGQYRNPPEKKDWLTLKKISLRNLKGDNLQIPLGRLTMVCGISGAGKSTLVRELLKTTVQEAIEKNTDKLPASDIHGGLINGNAFKKVIEVDQEPIGKTPRSSPATYIKAFDIIRDYFATLPESKVHGYTKSHFSFNTKGGRCENCAGAGRVKLEMNFLPDTYVPCEECNGARFGEELLGIKWNDKNISEILKMSFEEAADFFSFHTRLEGMMKLMVETGLGYLTLGQSSPTLSGGEAQRLKLVSELTHGLPTYKEKSRGILAKNLYILEEPTIGLHMRDCERLINILHRLVDQGHTVVVIEHNLDLIAEADHLVEIGPEGGENGGHILYQGEAKGILKVKKSPTAPFLKKMLK